VITLAIQEKGVQAAAAARAAAASARAAPAATNEAQPHDN